MNPYVNIKIGNNICLYTNIAKKGGKFPYFNKDFNIILNGDE